MSFLKSILAKGSKDIPALQTICGLFLLLKFPNGFVGVLNSFGALSTLAPKRNRSSDGPPKVDLPPLRRALAELEAGNSGACCSALGNTLWVKTNYIQYFFGDYSVF